MTLGGDALCVYVRKENPPSPASARPEFKPSDPDK